MMEKLRAVRARYEELGQLLQQPDVAADPAQYARLMKEYKNLTPLAEACDAYAQAQHTFEGAKELLEEGGLEPELKEMAQQEYSETKQRLEQLEEEGYLDSKKEFVGRRPNTTYRLLPYGREQFTQYVALLESLLAQAEEEKPET